MNSSSRSNAPPPRTSVTHSEATARISSRFIARTDELFDDGCVRLFQTFEHDPRYGFDNRLAAGTTFNCDDFAVVATGQRPEVTRLRLGHGKI